MTARARRIIASRGGAGEPAGLSLPVEGHGPRDDPKDGPHRRAAVDGLPAVPGVPLLPGAVVLGVDPGTATTGYGFVRGYEASGGANERCVALAFGVVETRAEDPMPRRLLTLFLALRALIAEHRPSEAAVEKLFFGRNTTTAISVGQARGVILLALAEAGVPVSEYTPAEVKQGMAGSGRAEKGQMQRMTQAFLDLPEIPTPDDAADALAIALCHTRLSRLRSFGVRH